MVTTWFAITFKTGVEGYVLLQDGVSQAVYYSNGQQVGVEEHVEYTCTDMNAAQPSWYVPPTE
jgi:hypothetical protein